MSHVSGTVNIASGRPVTLREIALAAADCLYARDRAQFATSAAQENEPPSILGDNRRLADEVGWHPSYDLLTGIAHTVRSWHERQDS